MPQHGNNGRGNEQQQPYPPHSNPLPDRPPQRSSHPVPQAVHPVQVQPQQTQQVQQWGKPEVLEGKEGSPGSQEGESGGGKPLPCEAYPFSDPEMGGLVKAGGLGMLGHRFYRQTTINWCYIPAA